MKQICIFGGTTEGRVLAERLAKAGVKVDVHVATDYGEQVLPRMENLTVYNGRLTPEMMRESYGSHKYCAVVDATHPFAVEVTKNIKLSLEGLDIPYFRLLRNVEDGEMKDCQWYDSTEECVAALEKTKGTIFLTTGSKELEAYCTQSLKERLVVRVLPSVESISICENCGIAGGKIVAMQGPFSKEGNEAMFRQFHASHVVTKQTGKRGGLPEKIAAAKAVGATLHMIGCPEKNEDSHLSFEEVVAEVEKICGVAISPESSQVDVTLCGVGMGTSLGMTVEVNKAIENADVIFGAKRLLELCPQDKKCYPYYLAKDILPALLQEEKDGKIKRAAILFSGDSGFYSGAQGLYEAFKENPKYHVKVLPGISSLVSFASKLAVSWQDAGFYSTHGVEAKVWEQQFCQAFCYEKKSFFLTSGKEDVARMCELVTELGGLQEEDLFVYGYQLSYEEEEIKPMDLLAPPRMEGLYVIYLYRKMPKQKKLTPGIRDEEFLRDKVPMTKEEVRAIVLSKMNLHKDSVFLDIGGGTGSVSVEVAGLHPEIKVYAFERKKEAVELFQKNMARFSLRNVTLIEKEAPEGMEDLPKVDVAFLGGTGGRLEEILKALYKNNPKMQVLFTAVTLESMVAMEEALKSFPDTESSMTQISITRAKPVGDYHMLTANNPIFLYDIDFSGKSKTQGEII